MTSLSRIKSEMAILDGLPKPFRELVHEYGVQAVLLHYSSAVTEADIPEIRAALEAARRKRQSERGIKP